MVIFMVDIFVDKDQAVQIISVAEPFRLARWGLIISGFLKFSKKQGKYTKSRFGER